VPVKVVAGAKRQGGKAQTTGSASGSTYLIRVYRDVFRRSDGRIPPTLQLDQSALGVEALWVPASRLSLLPRTDNAPMEVRVHGAVTLRPD
jgi:hypothetical protein